MHACKPWLLLRSPLGRGDPWRSAYAARASTVDPSTANLLPLSPIMAHQVWCGLWLAVTVVGAPLAPPNQQLQAAGAGAPPPPPTSGAGQEGGLTAVDIPCTTETEMYTNGVFFIGSICCAQANELCPDGDHLIPSTCTSYSCSRTVARVADACKPLFKQSAFFDGASSLIHDLGQKCPSLDDEAYLQNNVDVTNHAWVHHVDSHGMQIVDPLLVPRPCGKTFHGGQSPKSGEADLVVTLSSATGRRMQLNFEALWLTPFSAIKVYDGLDRSSPLLALVTGIQAPVMPIRSTGSAVTVVIGHMNGGYAGPSVGTAEGWSFNVTCTCDPVPLAAGTAGGEEVQGGAAPTVGTATGCGAHGTCKQLHAPAEPGIPAAGGSTEPVSGWKAGWDTCVCHDGYRGEACDERSSVPPPPPPSLPECQACQSGYSCLGGVPPCWPHAITFGPTVSNSANAGYTTARLGQIYHRTEATCLEAPVYQSTMDAFADNHGNPITAFLYMRLGMWEGYWAIGPGKLMDDGTHVVDCDSANVVFESSSCPMDSTPGHPFSSAAAEDNTPCLDHWHECTSISSVPQPYLSQQYTRFMGCPAPPIQDPGWQANPLLTMKVIDDGDGGAGDTIKPIDPLPDKPLCGGVACGEDESCVRVAPDLSGLMSGHAAPTDTCWPDSYVLGGEVTQQDYNAGLCGEYTRTSTICDGAPVYVRANAWRRPRPLPSDDGGGGDASGAAGGAGGGGTLHSAYLYRRYFLCELLPEIAQKLSNCESGSGADQVQKSVWVIMHDNLDSPITSATFDCERYPVATLMSSLSSRDCGADPTALGCDGKWKECQQPDGNCFVPSNQLYTEDESIWTSSLGLSLASGREKDMVVSWEQSLQHWHWLALNGNESSSTLQR
jgi:hypothetical protein